MIWFFLFGKRDIEPVENLQGLVEVRRLVRVDNLKPYRRLVPNAVPKSLVLQYDFAHAAKN